MNVEISRILIVMILRRILTYGVVVNLCAMKKMQVDT